MTASLWDVGLVEERRFAPNRGQDALAPESTPEPGVTPEQGRPALDWAVGMHLPPEGGEFVSLELLPKVPER